MFGEFNNLTFGDTADLVEMQAAFTFGFFRVNRGAEKSVCQHCATSDRGSSD
jgi:hypothetical protein